MIEIGFVCKVHLVIWVVLHAFCGPVLCTRSLSHKCTQGIEFQSDARLQCMHLRWHHLSWQGNLHLLQLSDLVNLTSILSSSDGFVYQQDCS